jgi:hypothetical protein
MSRVFFAVLKASSFEEARSLIENSSARLDVFDVDIYPVNLYPHFD